MTEDKNIRVRTHKKARFLLALFGNMVGSERSGSPSTASEADAPDCQIMLTEGAEKLQNRVFKGLAGGNRHLLRPFHSGFYNFISRKNVPFYES